MQDGGAHPGGDAAAHHRRHGMLPSQGYKATRMQGRSSQAAGLLGPWAKQAGAGRRGEALLIHTHTHTPQPLSKHWGIISPFNHKKQICACHQRAVRMKAAAQTSMGDTHTHRGEKKKSCRNPNPAISSLFISSLYGAPQGKCYQTASEHLIQQRPSFGRRTKAKKNKR